MDGAVGTLGVSTAGILSGAADWTRSELWDIQAVIAEGQTSVTDKASLVGARMLPDPKVRAMLQTLLADRSSWCCVARRRTPLSTG
jgi:uncharacterized protein (TIGR03435 family)